MGKTIIGVLCISLAAAAAPASAHGSRGRFEIAEATIRERGDAEIQSLTDLYQKANFWESQPNVGNRKGSLESADEDLTLATASNQQDRFTVQTVVYDRFSSMKLDAVVYPSSNIAPGIATSPELPSANDRGTNWTTSSVHGFPALTVPAGFPTRIYDRSPVDGSIAPGERAKTPGRRPARAAAIGRSPLEARRKPVTCFALRDSAGGRQPGTPRREPRAA